MKQLLMFIQKEFLHVTRDRRTLLVLFGLPVVQILIFGFALTTEIKNSKVVVVEEVADVATTRLINAINSSAYFDVIDVVKNSRTAETYFTSGAARAVIVLPSNLYHDVLHMRTSQINILSDASDPNYATTVSTYISSIVRDQQAQLSSAGNVVASPIAIQTSMLYNPQLLGAPNFVPGVMALVLMLVCVMMTSISIVREKELGTIEVLLVSPFRPGLVIISKAIPYLILSLINFTTILILSVTLLGLPLSGNVALLYLEATLFICTCLSLGILISTVTKTQQAAMFISMMGLLLPTMLFSGFMFPIENMPLPLQIISNIVPSKWFYIIVKSILIKGLDFSYIIKETGILALMIIVIIAISVKSFKTRLQ